MTSEELIDEILCKGLDPISYSGRGMYGEHCVAVVVDRLGDLDGLPLKGIRTDSMGLSMVAYWPSKKATQALMEREEE